MTARGRALLAAGSVLLILGLILAAVVLALEITSTETGSGTGGDATTTATSTAASGDDGPATTTDAATNTTTDAPAPGQDTTATTGAPTGPGGTVPGGSAATSLTTPPAASPDELAARLAAAAAAAGFSILGVSDPDWELATVDAGNTQQGPYVATSYERGTAYLTTSQERSATFPEVPNTVTVTVRGHQGDLLDMGHVVVIRWAEGETSIIFSTNLPRADALAQANALEPIR